LHTLSLFLRSLLFKIVMIVATVVWACVCFLAAPLPYNKRFWVTSRWNVFIIWCAKVICGIRYEFKGYENLPDGPAIILSKHQSAWETIFLLPNLTRPLVYVFKKEILYIPFFGWGMALLRMIPIDRSQGKNAFAQVVRHGRRRLADGQWTRKASTRAAVRAWLSKPKPWSSRSRIIQVSAGRRIPSSSAPA
jgi:1-acyl-sn-glycerol-3-phosphate acyltransferase